MRRRFGEAEQGAAAVEFAIVATLLVIMLIGVMEYGRLWATQASLAQAAREAARELAINSSLPDVERNKRAVDHFNLVFTPFAAANVDLLAVDIEPRLVDAGTAQCRATVTPTYEMKTMTGAFGPVTLTATGMMRCGG